MRINGHDDKFKQAEKRSVIWIIFIIIAAVITTAIILTSSKELKEQKEASLRRELSRVLKTSEGILHHWRMNLKAQQEIIAHFESVRNIVSSHARDTAAINHAREVLTPWIYIEDHVGYAVFKKTTKGDLIPVLHGEQVGRDLFLQAKDTLQSALKGEFSLSRPFFLSNKEVITISATPIKNKAGNIIGVLAMELNLLPIFNHISHLGSMGNTGETYAFNENGEIITATRNQKSIPAGKKSALKKHPFFLEVQEMPEESNYRYNVKGYKDYRGVEVIGAWTWNPEFGVGIITEIDSREAYSSANIVRRAVWLKLSAGV